ncbi:uncharacterized protein DEA37_0000675 [Paragonimus westermani]|uniref:Reverse transcriptase RNase H-like domain-containing protein n=1 Tax=Paragonimus westermani TaxID=34504 RepID=A0A5J4NB50_9TREM|nr:uncharacterized protein DEA37_0000675 [Paragonimus westermani]
MMSLSASNKEINAMISHKFPDGEEKEITHGDRSTVFHERKHSQIKKQVLATSFAERTFRKKLHLQNFFLSTDHKSLFAVFDLRERIA